jgi:hypothetical protein
MNSELFSGLVGAVIGAAVTSALSWFLTERAQLRSAYSKWAVAANDAIYEWDKALAQILGGTFFPDNFLPHLLHLITRPDFKDVREAIADLDRALFDLRLIDRETKLLKGADQVTAVIKALQALPVGGPSSRDKARQELDQFVETKLRRRFGVQSWCDDSTYVVDSPS